MLSHVKGVTLVELLVVLAIIGILSIFSPAFLNIIESARMASSIRTLQSTLHFARSMAVTKNEWITVCGSIDGSTCVKNWNNANLLIFQDEDNDHIFNNNDQLFRQISVPSGINHWRGSGGRNYMRYRGNGSLVEWGRYTYCPKTDKNETKQLVLNRPGRPYINKESISTLQANGLCI